MRSFPPTPIRQGLSFWSSKTEQLVYEDAAETNPRGEREGAFSYIQKLAGVAERQLKEADWREEQVTEIFGPREDMDRVQAARRAAGERE